MFTRQELRPKIDPELLAFLKPHARAAIRYFVQSCSMAHHLKSPIVDVGCGYRTDAPEAMFSPNGNPSPLYIAFDNAQFFDQESAPQSARNLVANAIRIPLPDSSAQTVICTEVLEHVRDEAAVMGEISRIIRSGGRLVLTVPGIDIPKHEKPYQHDYRRYTPHNISQLLYRNRFCDVQMEERYFEGPPRRQTNLLITAIREAKE